MMELFEIRKKFHERPETCWTEFWTTAEICKYLDEFGYDLMIGRDIIQEGLRKSVPDSATLEKWYQNAINLGSPMKFLKKMRGGFTGVIGILDTGKSGPVVAFRADIDALPIKESKRRAYRPSREGWRSKYEGKMHACGHDIHLTIGLGIAEYLSKNKNSLRGKFVMIFSPAEENGKGCLSLSKLSIIKELQYIFTYHDSTMPLGGNHFIVPRIFFRFAETYTVKFSKGKGGAFDVSQYAETIQTRQKKSAIDIIHKVVKGMNSSPSTGNDALMAACMAVINLKTIPRKPDGYSRIFIRDFLSGKEKGLYRGADPCRFTLIIRSDSDEIGYYTREKVMQILETAAKMHDVKFKVKKDTFCYPAWNDNDEELVQLAIDCWKEIGMGDNFIKYPFGELGSDDVIYIMKEVVKNGGKAIYLGLVSDDDSGRLKNIHTDRFDIKDSLITVGVNLITKMIEKIL